jgi:hypothetical protein
MREDDDVCEKVGVNVGKGAAGVVNGAAGVAMAAARNKGGTLAEKLVAATTAAIGAGATEEVASELAQQACEQVLSEANTISDKIRNIKSSTVGADISDAVTDSAKGSLGGGGGGLKPVINIP